MTAQYWKATVDEYTVQLAGVNELSVRGAWGVGSCGNSLPSYANGMTRGAID